LAVSQLFYLNEEFGRHDYSGMLRQQLRDLVDELLGGVDRRAGAVERHVDLGSHPVIGNRLDVVSLGQELAQLATEPGLVSRQPGKLGMHALVGFGVSSRAFRDQRLRRVKAREVGIAAGVFAYSGGENSSRATQALTGLVQMLLRFRRHRSMPSRRISRISEVRSS
jgi:hypothetical protein